MLKKIAAATEQIINNIPPVISLFHAIMRTPVRIRTGILCTRKPRSFLQITSFPSNTSKENIIIKRIARIASTLGIQNKIRSFISFWLQIIYWMSIYAFPERSPNRAGKWVA
jgi:hypothetical protein